MQNSRTALEAVARRHAEVESAGDLDALMETMEGEPVYEFYPLGKYFRGMAETRRFYDHLIRNVLPRITGVKQISEATGDDGLVLEYTVALKAETPGAPDTLHRVSAVLVYGREKLSGERMFSDDAFFHAMLGPLRDELQPIDLTI